MGSVGILGYNGRDEYGEGDAVFRCGARSEARRKRPASRRSASRLRRSIAVAAAVRARPDEVEFAVLHFAEIGEDRGRERGIVEADREIVALLVRGFLPGGADFGVMQCAA